MSDLMQLLGALLPMGSNLVNNQRAGITTLLNAIGQIRNQNWLTREQQNTLDESTTRNEALISEYQGGADQSAEWNRWNRMNQLYGPDVAGPEPAMTVGGAAGSTTTPDTPDELSYLGMYNMAKSELEGYGEQQRKDTRETYADASRNVAASLTGRGMGNTTVLGNMLTGVANEESDAMARLDEALGMNRINVLGGYGNNFLSAQSNLTANEKNSADQYSNNLINLKSGANSEYMNILGRNTDQMLGLKSNFSVSGPSWQNPVDAITSGWQNWTTMEQQEDAQAAAESAQNQAMWTGIGSTAATVGTAVAMPYLMSPTVLSPTNYLQSAATPGYNWSAGMFGF